MRKYTNCLLLTRISGQRRYYATKAFGYKELSRETVNFKEELEELKCLLLENEYRERTKEALVIIFRIIQLMLQMHLQS